MKHSYDPKAIELNNKAVDFIQYNQDDSALIYLDKALKVDSTYYIAYSNKANVYCNLKAYKKALKEAENVVRVKPNLAEGWTMAGLLNDRTGDSVKAKKCYKRSIELYETRIINRNKGKDLEANTFNMAIALILSGDRIKAQLELEKLREVNSKNILLDSLLAKDRTAIINQLLNH